MVANLLAQKFPAARSGAGDRNINDPSGSKGLGLALVESTNAPVVTFAGNNLQKRFSGETAVFVFNSTQPGAWEFTQWLYGATMQVSGDDKSCVVYWSIPSGHPGVTLFIGVRCTNQAVQSEAQEAAAEATALVHININQIREIGPGKTYASKTAAFAAAKADTANGNGKGDTFITYLTTANDAANVIRLTDGGGSNQPNYPPSGQFTVDNSGADPVFTVQKYTTVTSMRPVGFVFDANGITNTNLAAYRMHGKTLIESDVVAAGAGSNSDPNDFVNYDCVGIVLQGLGVKNSMSGSIRFDRCNNCAIRYSGFVSCGKGAAPKEETLGIQINKCNDILVEFSGNSGGRYPGVSDYISKRILTRGILFRLDESPSPQPIGGRNSYRAEDVASMNCYVFDADQPNFWDGGRSIAPYTNVAGLFGAPATGAHNFPKRIKYYRCGALNCDLAFSAHDGYDVAFNNAENLYQDCFAAFIGGHPEAPYAHTAGITRDGPFTFKDFSFAFLKSASAPANPANSSNFIGTGRSYTVWQDGIFYNTGWDTTSQSVVDRGPLAMAGGYGNEAGEIWFKNILISGFAHSNVIVGQVSSDYYTLDNVVQNQNPISAGWKYVTRMEDNYSGPISGCKKGLELMGKPFSFYSNADSYLDTGLSVANLLPQREIFQLFRAHSYTPHSSEVGAGSTLQGNRGLSQLGNRIEDAINSALGFTPYPMSVFARAFGSSIKVTWKKYSNNFMTNIAGWKIYVDGVFWQQVAKEAHGVELQNLLAGHQYSITVTAVDSVKGESGHSKKILVTI